MKTKIKKKNKFYGIYSKEDNFLYGVFPFSKTGYIQAKEYINKKFNKNKNIYIKKK
jgi:hypothetical protein